MAGVAISGIGTVALLGAAGVQVSIAARMWFDALAALEAAVVAGCGVVGTLGQLTRPLTELRVPPLPG